MLRQFFISLATATLALSAHASIVVQSYSMVDGANLHGAYFDNAYNGTNNGGLLSGGTGDLTDGVLSTSVVAGYGAWAPYVLWDGLSPVITFDLGARHDLGSVTVHFKYYPQAAVYMPGSLGLRFSDDGVDYGGAALRTLTDPERVPGGNDADGVFEVLTGPATGRFLELTLNNGPENRWLALAEVVFEGTPSVTNASVPEPDSAALALLALSGASLVRHARRRADLSAPR